MTPERIIHANGVNLCVQTFGAATDPALLLIAGAASSMDWWEDGFCQRLADGSRFVIRYDLRDTGRSTSYPPGQPGYRFDDLVGDAVALLAALQVARVHVVGISMGGAIALHLALDHPDRVATLTLMSTSPGGPGGPDNPGLPPMSPRLQATFSQPAPPPDWTDRDAVIDHQLEQLRLFAGPQGFDDARMRTLIGQSFDRTPNVATLNNHWSVGGEGPPLRPRLNQVRVPTLVVHGTDDPLFPIAHAEATAHEVPGAHLLRLEGVGHEMPPAATWDLLVPALLQHTAA